MLHTVPHCASTVRHSQTSAAVLPTGEQLQRPQRRHQRERAGAAASPPHLVYILTDDHGWANFGFHNAQALTPNIDRLATVEGAELTRHYAYRFCSPSRASLMSGRLPFHVNQNNSAEWGWTATPVHLGMSTLPERLREANYSTAHVGKWVSRVSE